MYPSQYCTLPKELATPARLAIYPVELVFALTYF